jgi:hypothetical protein
MRPTSSSSLAVLAGLCVCTIASAGCSSGSLAPAASPGGPRERVRVHVETPNAQLQAEHGEAWKPVCNSPCSRRVPLGVTYRMVASGAAYPPFRIDAKPGAHVDLEAKPSTDGRTVGGVLLIVAGVVLVPAGYGIMWESSRDGGRTEPAGPIALGFGLASLVAGIVLFASSHDNYVEQTTRPTTNAASPRAAAWRASDELERRAPRTTNMSLFSRTF